MVCLLFIRVAIHKGSLFILSRVMDSGPYCIAVRGNSKHTKLDKLFKLQKKALRICLGCHYRTHSAPLFMKLKILNIFDLYFYSIALLGFFYFQKKYV